MLGIMIVDDEFLVRIGIRKTIDWGKYGFEIVCEAENGEEGLDLAKRVQPDIIITDIRMPNMDGLEFMAKLKENGVEAKIIVLSGYDEFDYARTALNHGALAYLLKPIENQQLFEVVQTIGQKIVKERELTQHYRELEQELPDIEKFQLIKMMDDSHFSLNGRDFKKLNFPLNDNKILIVIRVDEYSLFQINNVDKIEKFYRSFLTLNNELDKNHKLILLKRANDEWIIIIQHNIDDNIENIYNFCQNVLEFIYDRSNLTQANVTFSLGISNPFSDISKISIAYNEATRAANFKLIPKSNSIRHIGETFQSNMETYIEQAIALIKNNYDKNITIETVANNLSVSASHLMHLFKNKLGKTFGDCLSDIRVDVAKELLKNSACKIYEVSEKVGYKDPKYFSQVFKKATGLTPRNFIRKTVTKQK